MDPLPRSHRRCYWPAEDVNGFEAECLRPTLRALVQTGAFGLFKMENEDEQLYEMFQRREKFDQEARGKIIYAAVRVESVIEQIIAEHFCDEKDKAMFISLMFIVGQVTFSQKLIILKKLFKEFYPDLLKLFPKMFNRLEKLRELRNKLAHSRIGYSFYTDREERRRSFNEKSVPGTTLEYYKDGYVVHEDISRGQIEETLAEANAYQDILGYIEMEIKNRAKNKNNANFKIAINYLRTTYPEQFLAEHA
jgi:hypothetical protein